MTLNDAYGLCSHEKSKRLISHLYLKKKNILKKLLLLGLEYSTEEKLLLYSHPQLISSHGAD